MQIIDPTKTYETHRPAELVDETSLAAILLMLANEDEIEAFNASREAAGTGGPIMVSGRAATMPGAALIDLFILAEEKGARPCYLDAKTGQVFLGEFVFVPRATNEREL